jgi:hypothetical protein
MSFALEIGIWSFASPLNIVISSIWKTRLLQNYEGKSMTYALLPNLLVIWKGLAHRVYIMLKFPKGKHYGLKWIKTISPMLNYLSLHLALAKFVYDSVLRDRRRLTSACISFIYSEKSRLISLGLGGIDKDLRSKRV